VQEDDARGGGRRSARQRAVGQRAGGSQHRATVRGIAEARVRGRQVPVPLRAVLTLMRVHGNLM